jgi:hypothetical protein
MKKELIWWNQRTLTYLRKVIDQTLPPKLYEQQNNNESRHSSRIFCALTP